MIFYSKLILICISLISQPANADVATGNEGLVVQEVLPIVHIGTTSLYERTLTEADGKLPFQLIKQPATENAIITKPADKDKGNFIEGSKVRTYFEIRTDVHSYLFVYFCFTVQEFS